MRNFRFSLDPQLLLQKQMATVARKHFAQVQLVWNEIFLRSHSHLGYLIVGLLQHTLHGIVLEDSSKITAAQAIIVSLSVVMKYPLLPELYWLPVGCQLQFKVLVIKLYMA